MLLPSLLSTVGDWSLSIQQHPVSLAELVRLADWAKLVSVA